MEFLAGTVGCKGFCLPSEDTLQDHMGGGGKIPCDFDCRAGSACGSTKRMLTNLESEKGFECQV